MKIDIDAKDMPNPSIPINFENFFNTAFIDSKRQSNVTDCNFDTNYTDFRNGSIVGRNSLFGNVNGNNLILSDLIKEDSDIFDQGSNRSNQKEALREIKVPILKNSRKKKAFEIKENIDFKPLLTEFKTVIPDTSKSPIKVTSEIPQKPESPKIKKDSKNCCTCKKTKCLKLYCECFASKSFCGKKCKCNDCHNLVELQDLRDLIIQETIEKNPLAFNSKYKKTQDNTKTKLHSRGCNCKKTSCVKNYCECFTAGIGCSKICKCSDCKNEKTELKDEEAQMYKEKILRKRKKPNYLYEFYFQKYNSLKQNQEN